LIATERSTSVDGLCTPGPCPDRASVLRDNCPGAACQRWESLTGRRSLCWSLPSRWSGRRRRCGRSGAAMPQTVSRSVSSTSCDQQRSGRRRHTSASRQTGWRGHEVVAIMAEAQGSRSGGAVAVAVGYSALPWGGRWGGRSLGAAGGEVAVSRGASVGGATGATNKLTGWPRRRPWWP
jgi:hypothetical protein